MADDRAKIVIIDDDPDFVETVQAMLEAGGYDVFSAAGSQTGLELIRDKEPDLLILDIMMDSTYEGFSVVSTLRGTAEWVDFRDMPIIMVSAVKQDYGSRFTLPEGGEHLQGDVYLDKPVTPKELLATVKQLLEES